MLAAMPAKVWKEWRTFFCVEPFGPMQEDYRAGVLAMLAHNAGFKGDAKGPHDFFRSLEAPDDPNDDPRVIQVMARAYVIAAGGKVIESGKPDHNGD